MTKPRICAGCGYLKEIQPKHLFCEDCLKQMFKKKENEDKDRLREEGKEL